MITRTRLQCNEIFISNLQEGVQFKGFCNGNHGIFDGVLSLLFFVQLKSGIQRFDPTTISEFGFTLRGLLEIYVKDSSYKGIKQNDIGLESMGFFLSARDVWLHVLQDLDHGEICCVLESKLITPLLTFKDLENQSC